MLPLLMLGGGRWHWAADLAAVAVALECEGSAVVGLGPVLASPAAAGSMLLQVGGPCTGGPRQLTWQAA
jgi:hypothetical protein